MKRLIVTTISLVSLAATGVSASFYTRTHGSAFGNFSTARTSGQGKGSFGLGAGIAEATSVVGWLNYGLSQYVDGRLKLALIDPDEKDVEDDIRITLGADFKYQFWTVGSGNAYPLDMAVGGMFEYVDYGHRSALQVGAQIIGSYPFQLQNGTILSPYGRFNVRLEDRNEKFKDEERSDSDLEFGLNGGVAWEVSPTINVYGEFQIDGNDGIFLGIDFSVF